MDTIIQLPYIPYMWILHNYNVCIHAGYAYNTSVLDPSTQDDDPMPKYLNAGENEVT